MGPKKRKYKQYLWDSDVPVPTRSAYSRTKENTARCVPTPAVSEGPSVPSDETGLRKTCSLASGGSSLELEDDDCLLEDEAADRSDGSSDNESGRDASNEEPSDSEGDSEVPREEPSDSESERDSPSEAPGASATSELEEPLYPGSKLSRAESLLLLMAHSLRHHGTKEATDSLLKVIDAHLPMNTDFPSSKFTFFRQFSGKDILQEVHFYCPQCEEYLGVHLPPQTTCPACSMCHNCDDLMKAGSFFFMLDMAAQLRDVLKAKESSLHSIPRGLVFDVTDIRQSSMYNKLPLKDDDITVTWNTDGVPVYESTNFSIWPLQLQVNELDLKERVKNIVLAGLWFGSRKPPMNTFLKPFVEKMNDLATDGISWTSDTGEQKISFVYPGPCTVDSVARCMVMNMTQFNGAFGCAWCEHEGTVIKKGKGSCRVYPMTRSVPKERSHESFTMNATDASNAPGGQRYGVKGISVLLMLSFFKFPSNFVVDHMHAVCSGFVRATTYMWLSGKGTQQFHLGHRLADLDSRLLAIKPVWEISRLPRSLNLRKYWKSSEWRNWLLFFSPVVLKGILPTRFFKNWMKFVQLMHILLSACVPADKMSMIQQHMFEFLKEYESLYGMEYMTYNAHLLTHLVGSVADWGPLWGYSAFPFENLNGRLLKFVCGTRYAASQIVDKYCILQALPKLFSLASVGNSNETVRQIASSLLKGYDLKKNSVVCGKFLFHGKKTQSGLECFFRKVTYNNFTFCTSDLDKSRRLNSYVCYGNYFGQITHIILSGDIQGAGHQSPKVQFRIIKLSVVQVLFQSFGGDLSLNRFVEVRETNEVLEVNAEDARKCIALRDNQSLFLCVLEASHALEAN